MATQILTDPKRFAALDVLPQGYTLAQRLDIDSQRKFIVLNLLGIIPLMAAFVIFSGMDWLLRMLNIRSGLDLSLAMSALPLILITIIGMLVMLSVHELCHGLAFQLFGARPRYGVNLRKFVAYASADRYYLTRDAYIVVALAPLVILSIATVALMVFTGGWLRFIVMLLGAGNAGGAIGDLWFVTVCLHYPRHLLIRDFGEGADLYAPPSDHLA